MQGGSDKLRGHHVASGGRSEGLERGAFVLLRRLRGWRACVWKRGSEKRERGVCAADADGRRDPKGRGGRRMKRTRAPGWRVGMEGCGVLWRASIERLVQA